MAFLGRGRTFDWQSYQEQLKRLTGQDFATQGDALTWWQKNKPTANENK
jgi:hypothetical protein